MTIGSSLYFTPDQDEELSNFIKDRYSKGERKTFKIVAEKALDIYYQAISLGHKAALIEFAKQKKPYILPDGSFSSEFQIYEEKARDDYEYDPSYFFQHYPVPQFKASYQWVSDFFKRKRFSIRQAHLRRRGTVNPELVATYLDKIQEARAKYGDELLFNMDETSIHTNSTPANTIAPTGSEDVFINIKCNEKECFTVIGTCTKLRTYPLMIVAKGTTVKCEAKFGRLDETVIIHNLHGWTNNDIMFQYLNWLHEQAGKPCALILDSCSAHTTKAVEKYANNLGIELIFVPPNGIGTYQPLDRAIFGAIKAKLAAANYDFSDLSVRQFNENLVRAWRSISKNCLHKAWCIPGLDDECHTDEEVEIEQ